MSRDSEEGRERQRYVPRTNRLNRLLLRPGFDRPKQSQSHLRRQPRPPLSHTQKKPAWCMFLHGGGRVRAYARREGVKKTIEGCLLCVATFCGVSGHESGETRSTMAADANSLHQNMTREVLRLLCIFTFVSLSAITSLISHVFTPNTA